MITASATPALLVPTTPAPPPRLLDVLQQAAAERGHFVETIQSRTPAIKSLIVISSRRLARNNAARQRFPSSIPEYQGDRP
jgi:hypothetical protein